MELGLSGLASGFDWRSLVDQLADVERTPQNRLRSEQQLINQRNTAYGSIKTELGNLRAAIEKLKTGNFFLTRTASSSAESIATAKASPSTAPGTYSFNITRMASAASLKGGPDIGQALGGTGVTLGGGAFSQAINAGTFTVNGKRVTVELTDTLQNVFDKISAATGGTVTGSYDPATDKIGLSGGTTPVVLGSATDTSNFLRATRLYNSATPATSITSTEALGGVKVGSVLDGANLRSLTSGTGEFLINGVSFTYDTAVDTVSGLLDKINNSSAGVTASYDSINDRFVLTNKVTGDIGVAVEDKTGNFAAVAGLMTGSLERGSDLIYKLNNGGELRSQTNTIGEDSTGIPGLAVTALAQGQVSITVGTDIENIKKGIKAFIEAYNKAQSAISTQTASTTDAKGKVTAGVLASDSAADDISSNLRTLAYSHVTGLTGAIQSLDALGISTSGDNDQLTIADEEKLDEALASNMEAVRKLFSDDTNGIAARLTSYLDKTVGENGTLITKQDTLTKEASSIDTQIAEMERLVLSNRERMISSFLVMEETQARVNQQLSFLQQRFGASSK